jgi:hypothetical protein
MLRTKEGNLRLIKGQKERTLNKEGPKEGGT